MNPRELPLVLTLTGFAALALDGWVGRSVVYVHGMHVLNLVDEPAPVPLRRSPRRSAWGRRPG